MESTLWLLCPIIGVPLGLSLYKSYTRWNATAGLLDLIVGASYLSAGVTMTIWRISRRYFPQSFSAPLAVAALLLAPLFFRQSFGLLAHKYKLLAVIQRPKSVCRKYFLLLAVVFGIVLTLVAIWPKEFILTNIVLASVLACCGALTVSLGSRWKNSRLRSWPARILLASIPALAVWDLTMEFNTHHLGFYLAPANEVIHGRLMLTDTFSQYGVGIFYFLAASLKILGFGYGSLVLLTGGLTALTSLLIFKVLTLTTRSTTYAVIGTCAAAILGPLASSDGPANFPSTGFLRFGPTWLLIVLLVLALRRDSPHQVWITLSSVVLAVSFVWSFESAFYSVGTFVIVGILGPALIGEKTLSLRFVRSALISISVVCLAGVLLTRAYSGSAINLLTYARYLEFYSTSGIWALPIEPWSPGIPVLLCSVASVIALVTFLTSTSMEPAEIRREFFPILATTAYAFLAFTYFLGRSHPNNLLTVSAPFVVMITMWMSHLGGLRRFNGKSLRVVTIWVCLFGAALTGLVNWSRIEINFSNSALGLILKSPSSSLSVVDRVKFFLDNPIANSRFETIKVLLDDNLPQGSSVLIVVDADLMTESLVRLERVNPITLSNPTAESQLPIEVQRITAQVPNIPCGSYVLLQQPDSWIEDSLLLQVKSAVQANFQLTLVSKDDEFSLYTMNCA